MGLRTTNIPPGSLILLNDRHNDDIYNKVPVGLVGTQGLTLSLDSEPEQDPTKLFPPVEQRRGTVW